MVTADTSWSHEQSTDLAYTILGAEPFGTFSGPRTRVGSLRGNAQELSEDGTDQKEFILARITALL